MNFKNSSSTVSPKQSLSSNNLLKPVSFSTRYKLPILIILSIVIFLLGIFTFVFILKYIQKRKKKIRRQNVIIKKNCESNSDNLEDPHVTLLEQNYGGTIGNTCVIPTDPIIKPKIIDTSSDTPRGSTTISVSSLHISTANPSNETNHADELFGFDFTDIPLRHVKLSNSNLTDPTLPEVINHSSHDSSENPYVDAYKEQEKEKANARKQSINTEKLTSSTSSEESCL